MHTIMCDWHSSRLTLCGEFGIWDARTRIDLLVLRQFAKIIAYDRDSTRCRALCLSADSLTHDRCVGAAPSMLARAMQDWWRSKERFVLRIELKNEARATSETCN